MPSVSQADVAGSIRQTVEFVRSGPPVPFVARAGSVSPVCPSKIELNTFDCPGINSTVSGVAVGTGGAVTVGV